MKTSPSYAPHGTTRSLRVLVVLLSGVALTCASPAAAAASSAQAPPGSSVRIDDAKVVRLGSQGEEYAFAEPLSWSQAQVDSINAAQGVGSEAMQGVMRSLGGVDPDVEHISLVLEGATSAGVEITNMGVIKDQCGPPLDGGFFESPAAGSGTNVNINFDLDKAVVIAESPNEDGTYSEFFKTHSVSLAQGEQVPFLISVSSQSQYCQFRLVITVVDSSGSNSQVIDNAGGEFSVTGKLYDTTPGIGSFHRYKSLYIGGVASNDGRVRQDDPNKYVG